MVKGTTIFAVVVEGNYNTKIAANRVILSSPHSAPNVGPLGKRELNVSLVFNFNQINFLNSRVGLSSNLVIKLKGPSTMCLKLVVSFKMASTLFI